MRPFCAGGAVAELEEVCPVLGRSSFQSSGSSCSGGVAR